MKKLDSLLKDESGQATVEYVLVLAVVVIMASAITSMIIRSLDRGILVFGGKLEKLLKTGRAPIDIWSN